MYVPFKVDRFLVPVKEKDERPRPLLFPSCNTFHLPLCRYKRFLAVKITRVIAFQENFEILSRIKCALLSKHLQHKSNAFAQPRRKICHSNTVYATVSTSVIKCAPFSLVVLKFSDLTLSRLKIALSRRIRVKIFSQGCPCGTRMYLSPTYACIISFINSTVKKR